MALRLRGVLGAAVLTLDPDIEMGEVAMEMHLHLRGVLVEIGLQVQEVFLLMAQALRDVEEATGLRQSVEAPGKKFERCNYMTRCCRTGNTLTFRHADLNPRLSSGMNGLRHGLCRTPVQYCDVSSWR